MTRVISPSESDDDGFALFSFDGVGLRRWLMSWRRSRSLRYPNLWPNSIWSPGPIAQLAERAPDKGEVPGSNPGRPTMYSRRECFKALENEQKGPGIDSSTGN